MSNTALKYRTEVDGLRALAVLPVIFYHAGFDFISGGFLGVDVFFVISGYLITSILMQDLQTDQFSIVKFYERRIRRIIPMLFTVMVACLPMAWLFMTPNEMIDFGYSLLSSTYFISNMYFRQTIDYFNPSSDQFPLIHTWSLSIEEQFYIIFPIALFILYRFLKPALLGFLILGFFISLGLAEYAAAQYPQANFFLLPTRAWELLAGAILALTIHKINQTPFWIAQGLSSIGLVLLCISYISLDNSMALPGLLSLIPVIGTCLIIGFARKGTAVAQALSLKWIVWIGLISYSLYLWHQPLFAFARIYYWEDITALHYGVLILLTFILSMASWHWIEQPFRQKNRFSRQQIFIFFTIAMMALTTIGAAIHFNKGFPNRNDRMADIKSMENRLVRNAGLTENCNSIDETPAECQTYPNPTILLWGDSYAMHLAQGFMAHDPNTRIIQKTASVCGPVFNASPIVPPRYNAARAKKCLAFSEGVRNLITKTPSLQYVVMSSPFWPYLNPKGSSFIDDQTIKNTTWSPHQAFTETLDWIKAQGKTPIIISPPPRTGRNFKACYSRMIYMGRSPEACNFPIETHQNHSSMVVDFLKNLEHSHRVIWLSDFMCQGGICKTYNPEDDIYYYNDDGHLSIEGVQYLGETTNLFNISQN